MPFIAPISAKDRDVINPGAAQQFGNALVLAIQFGPF